MTRARRTTGGALQLARRFTLAGITALADGERCDGWVVEPAWDGHRVLATRAGDDVRLAAADFRDWTATFAAIARALAALPATSLAIDGVACALDAAGVPSFAELRARVAGGRAVAGAVLACWDLMWLDGEDLRARPLSERRTKLAALLARAPASLVASPALDGELSRVLAAARAAGMRGVVARPRDARYGDAPWHAHPACEWTRALSPPPPLTNADKVLYPRDGVCKRDVAAYYRDVAPALVPLLADRPVVVQRWPDGIDDFDWYQHRMPPRAPDYIRAAWVDSGSKDRVRRIVIDNADALLWFVNQAGLTYHGFASRLAALAEPDFAVIDLDPGERTTWSDTVDVALAVRRVLELLELPSVVKTSGHRGVHVLVPLAPGHAFAHAEALADGVADLVLRVMPDRCTRAYDKDKRGGRMLVDTRQFVAKTLVVPYSLRASDGATVSTPLAWDELSARVPPGTFTLRGVRARLDRHGDLAAPLRAGTAQLARALAQLDAQRS